MAGRTTSLLLFVIVAVVTAGAGTGMYFAATHGKGGTSGQVVAGPTSTPALVETATPPIPTPTSTEPPSTATEPPTLAPTPDTRVPIRDLPTRDQIQLGPDGKYFVADRGDGCRWAEALRLNNSPEIGEEVILRTDCLVDFQIVFRPATGVVVADMP
jgi:hypothetical protein